MSIHIVRVQTIHRTNRVPSIGGRRSKRKRTQRKQKRKEKIRWVRKRTTERTNGETNGRRKERTNEGTKERMDEWTDEWMDERLNEQTNEGTNERTKEWMNGRTHEYMSGRMNEGAKEISAIDRVRLCTEVKTARHACPALAARNTIHIFFSFLLRMHVMFVLKIKRRIKLQVGKVYPSVQVGGVEGNIDSKK